MTLTPSGRRLLPHAEGVIGAVQQLGHLAQGLRGPPTGKLTVGTVLDPSVLRVGDLLARMGERYPQIEIELHQVVSHEALAGIRVRTLDASFYFGLKPEADLATVALRDIAYRVVMPTAWAGDLVDADWEFLVTRPWIVAPIGSSHRQLVLQLFAAEPGAPERTIESDNESVIANLVESGVGLSLVREEIARAAEDAGRCCVIWPAAQATTTLWLAYAAEREGDPLLAAVLAGLSDIWPIVPAALLTAAVTA